MRQRLLIVPALLLAIAVALSIATGQTRVNLGKQGANADFSGYTLTRPFQVGTQLPASCVAGQAFFKSDNPAGRNLYMCTALGTWVEQAAGTANGANVGTGVGIFAGLSDGVMQFRKLNPLSSRISITLDEAGQKVDLDVAESGFNLANMSGQLTASQLASRNGNSNTVQMFGGGYFEAGDCVQFDASGNVVSAGGACGELGVSAGTGLVQSGGQLSLDTALVPYAQRVSAVLSNWNSGADSIPAQSCLEQTIAASGAALGDAVASQWPVELPASLVGMMRISAASTLAVRLCNPTANTVTIPDGLQFGAMIVRNFQ